MPDRAEILRGSILHVPTDPFRTAGALRFHEDGGLLIQDGRIAACGEYPAVSAAHPAATVTDLRGGFLLPGFVDTHVHFPQVRVVGALGRQLLEWLDCCALPEEARMADVAYARRTAQAFTHALASHGTTTALVFGAHFAAATAELFLEAERTGLRIIAGLVISDRNLRAHLHSTPEVAYRESTALIGRFHGKGRLLYAVTPRFAFSTSEAMLEVCQTLLRENAGLRFQTHMNENGQEIAAVADLFPWAPDYFAVYERYGLCGPRAVLAHNVHPMPAELERLARTGTFVAHCPCSNSALGSGVFPMQRHLRAGVRFSLGTDVGAGTGFNMMKEAVHSYLVQRVAHDAMVLEPAQLLYLMTLAGAEALGLGAETGSFEAGKSADVVYLRAPEGSPLAHSLECKDTGPGMLSALLTQAGAESVREVRVEGKVVYQQ